MLGSVDMDLLRSKLGVVGIVWVIGIRKHVKLIIRLLCCCISSSASFPVPGTLSAEAAALSPLDSSIGLFRAVSAPPSPTAVHKR
ncbi:hypothetical protein OPV22_005271 [Ensete ventricosum]|uniref:Uncharacterized protein n=1 Tax=Ensete ventricosum TaxID=4639 RepID=A0AAV8RCG1_ENSVE|nr:hypothetical protein OPV22_005271 [Ensete ventricosum]